MKLLFRVSPCWLLGTLGVRILVLEPLAIHREMLFRINCRSVETSQGPTRYTCRRLLCTPSRPVQDASEFSTLRQRYRRDQCVVNMQNIHAIAHGGLPSYLGNLSRSHIYS